MHSQPRLMPRSWRLPARTARQRLTLLYGALFLASGAGLLAITYTLVSGTTSDLVYFTDQHKAGIVVGSPTPGHARPNPTFHGYTRASAPLSPTLQAVVAQARHQHASDLHHLLLWSVVALALMALVSIALGYYVAGQVLGPLRTITATARAISARNLGERVALEGPDDEFKALSDTLDELLARLQTAFEAQQHFVANASHELRSPLALEQTLLQLALSDQEPSIAAFQATCEKLLATSKRQQGLIEALLTLATSEGGLDHREPLDLSVLANGVLLAPRPEVEQGEIEITAAIELAPTIGHPGLVERLIANLIDNAVRYNTPGGHVHVQTTTADGRARLLVTNTGPNVPPAEIKRLFEPFQRLNGSRAKHQTGSYGLGLAIVQSIATAHHAFVAAQAQEDGGLAIEISFPARATTPNTPSPPPPSHEPHGQIPTTTRPR